MFRVNSNRSNWKRKLTIDRNAIIAPIWTTKDVVGLSNGKQYSKAIISIAISRIEDPKSKIYCLVYKCKKNYSV